MSAGQTLLVGFRPDEEDRILTRLREGALGGVILFGRNGKTADEVCRLCNRLWEASDGGKVDSVPVIAIDQEQGRVCRIESGLTRFPGAWALGTLDRPATTGRVATWVAKELKSLGLNLNLAPVADTATQPSVPEVLRERAFGTDPKRVSRHVGAWIQGSQGVSLAACAKHFPGHGAVMEDSHFKSPLDASPFQTLERVHLRPFFTAIKLGVASIMVGHVSYRALDPTTPASLSPAVIRGLMRKHMNYDGLVLTDDLEMEAVAERWDPLTAAIKGIQSGADMVLVGRHLKGDVDLDDLIRGLEEAARRDHIPTERLGAALRRVRRFRRTWILSGPMPSFRSPIFSAAGRLARRLTAESCG